MADWEKENTTDDNAWRTDDIPKIETAHLKGKKLTVAGNIEWQDQGPSQLRKGTFRLRLLRDGEEVEGSAQSVGPAPHARESVEMDFSGLCEHWV